MNKLIYKLSLSFLLAFLITSPVIGQMFSVDSNEQRERSLFATTVLSIGLEAADFTYSGSTPNDVTRLDFNDPIFRVKFETPGLEFNVGIGGAFTGMDNRNYVNINGQLSNNLILYRKENLFLVLPLQLSTDVKRVVDKQSDFEFQISSFTFGTGLGLYSRLSNTFSTSANLTPNYGFSYARGSFFGGQVFHVNGKWRLFINQILPENPIVLGYDFIYKKYSIEGDQYDYDFTGHTLTLGFGF